MGSNGGIDKQYQRSISLFNDSAHPTFYPECFVNGSDHFEFNWVRTVLLQVCYN